MIELRKLQKNTPIQVLVLQSHNLSSPAPAPPKKGCDFKGLGTFINMQNFRKIGALLILLDFLRENIQE